MRDITAIWFDLDDTLYDHTYSVCQGMEAVCAKFPGFGVRSPIQLAALYNRVLNLVYTAYVRGEIDFHEMRRRKLKLFYEVSEINAREAPPLDEFHSIYDEAYRRQRRATPGSIELLRCARDKGLQLAILTNGRQAIQEEKLCAIGLEWMIPYLLTAERAAATKPDPRIYHWALGQTGQNPATVLMVGDSFENDVEAALHCGLSAALYAPGTGEPTVATVYGPAPVINERSGVLDLLGPSQSSLPPLATDRQRSSERQEATERILNQSQ